MKNVLWAAAAAATVLAIVGCGGGATKSGTTEGGDVKLTGMITADGSSTVAPISEAMAEEFQAANPDVRVTVGTSGTGGGFKKFLNNETDISNASRPIKDSELEMAEKNGVTYVELPIAYDGLTVVVNPQNTWVDYLTIEELHKIFAPDSKITKWSEVRAGWPAEEMNIFSPGADSGTFDYFTEVVNEDAGASRQDGIQFSEDDNVLVTGVAGEKGGIGYFGFAYFEENASKLKAVPIVNPETGSPVMPSFESIQDGSYAPLSRPLFIYVRSDVMDRPEITAFVKFSLSAENAGLIKEVGYVALPQDVVDMSWQRYESKKLGTMYSEGSSGSLKDLMSK
jgi:phosphate transport system substrate-binding protein